MRLLLLLLLNCINTWIERMMMAQALKTLKDLRALEVMEELIGEMYDAD